jgi:chromosome segregation ATPase
VRCQFLIFLGLSLGAGAAVEELETLLKELRELRTLEQREREAWEREKGELELLLSQRRARLAEQKERNEDTRSRLEKDTAKLKEARAERAVLRDREKAYRTWRKRALAAVEAELARNPLAAGEEVNQRLAAAGRTGLLSDDMARFWNLALAVAARGVSARVETEEIEIAGEVRAVTVLRLGATAAVFLTPDGTRCGHAVVRDGTIVWEYLPAAHASAVAAAIRVARKDAPAAIVTVPVPGEGSR